MRDFIGADVINGRIRADENDMEFRPPPWMARGLQETRTGYGKRLNSGYMIRYEGREYRVYVTIYSNNGTMWFRVKGQRIVVS